MSVEALKKAASSSKVLIFGLFAAAITAAKIYGWVDQDWWQTTIANAFYMTMGGYSLVEVGRALVSGKVTPAEALADPAAAMKKATEDDDDEEEK